MSSNDYEHLPHDYFHSNAHTRQRLTDAEYARARAKLNETLRLPTHNRWVAEWLFADSHAHFHGNIVLPPESFQNSRAIHVEHLTSPHLAHIAPVLPEVFQYLKPHGSGTFRSATTVSVLHSELLFLPVAAFDHISVGYCFMAGSRYNERKQMVPTQFFARFTLDAHVDDLLVVVSGIQGNSHRKSGEEHCTVLLRSGPSSDGRRDFVVFSCPEAEYCFENLPSEVLSMTEAGRPDPLETTQTTPPDAVDLHPKPNQLFDIMLPKPRPNDPGSIPEASELFGPIEPIVRVGNCDTDNLLFVDDLDVADWPVSTPMTENTNSAPLCEPERSSAYADSSHLPWVIGEDGTAADGVGVPRHPGKSNTSSGAFDLDVLRDSLPGIGSALSGEIRTRMYAKTFQRTMNGAPSPTTGPNITATFKAADAALVTALREIAVQAYYSAVLPVSTDNRLICAIPEAANESSDCKPSHKATPLAPRRGQHAIRDWGGFGVQGISKVEAQRLEERKEAQRRRNRVSAARSYEKRKRLKALEKLAGGSVK